MDSAAGSGNEGRASSLILTDEPNEEMVMDSDHHG